MVQIFRYTLTQRLSFGFANTNLKVIEREKIRINPGLEDQEVVNFIGYSQINNPSLKRGACVSKPGVDQPKRELLFFFLKD